MSLFDSHCFRISRTHADLVHCLTVKTLNQMCNNRSRLLFPQHILSSCSTICYRAGSAERLLNHAANKNRDRSCTSDCRRIPRVHVEPQRSCAAVKRLISLFCQTSESIISYTNGLNYDQMSWVTCCHGTPCESCFIRSQHVLRSAKPWLLAPPEGSARPGCKSPLILGPPLPLNCFTCRSPQHIFPWE